MGDNTGAWIGAASNILGQVYNTASTSSMNRKTRQFTEDMWNRQNDLNLANWNRQNEYDSPKAQMQRFKDAGLNPNLVYGQSTTEAAPIKTSDTPNWSPHAPQIDPKSVGDSINTMYETKVKAATIDNLHEQNKNIVQDTNLKSAQEVATLKQAGYTDQEIQSLQQEIAFRKELNPISLQSAQAGVNKTQADTSYTIQAMHNASADLINRLKDSSIGRQKTAQEISEIAQRIINLKLEGKEHEFEVELNKMGLTKHDNSIMRLAFINGNEVLKPTGQFIPDGNPVGSALKYRKKH